MAGRGGPPGPELAGLGEGRLTLSPGCSLHTLSSSELRPISAEPALPSGAAHRPLCKEPCQEAGVPEQFYVLQTHAEAPGTLDVLLGADKGAPTATLAGHKVSLSGRMAPVQEGAAEPPAYSKNQEIRKRT